MQIEKFADHKINSSTQYNPKTQDWEVIPGNEFWRTRECSTRLPNGISIGRVDHFKVKSLKSLVNACVRQVIEREGMKGEHTITITMADPWDHNLNCARPETLKKTLVIKVTV